MFCSCKNDTEEKEPNVNVCPVCVGHPGTLPVPNGKAVRSVLEVGLALNGTLADFSEFDRKNYFYPDIPKGYQISQYKYPLVQGGELRGVKIKRIHLEEDTAKSSHERGDYSLVDYNRAGVPLMELVTEPVIRSGREASAFAKELQLILRALGVANANMEKGEMRVEANISVSDSDKLGTKVEIKNLNSFRSVERAVDYEIERQSDLLSRREGVLHETRGWDDVKQKTFSQRAKEESHDYRYFPEPDIPKVEVGKWPGFDADKAKKKQPELPEEKRKKYVSAGLKEDDANMFVGDERFGKLFDEASGILKGADKKIKILANYISSDLAGLVSGKEDWQIDPKSMAKLASMVSDGVITSRGAKDLLAIMVEKNIDPEDEAKKRGVIQKSDPKELENLVKKIIKDNPKPAEDFRAGKANVMGFLVGQAMKESKGAANPQVLKDLFERGLK